MTILHAKDANRLETVRPLASTDPAYFAVLNRPHEDIEQRTNDLDRIFTPARGLRVRQESTASDSVEVETGLILDTDGITLELANSGAVQTIGPVAATAAGMIRADLIYFNLTTKAAVILAGTPAAVGGGFSTSLWPALPAGLAGAVPLGMLYVGENIGVSINFSERLSGDVEGQIVDVRPSPGVVRQLFETVVGNLDTDITSGAVGSSVLVARADHRHPLNVDATVPATLAAGLAASVGVAATYARRDHRHLITVETNSGALLTDGTAAAGTVGEVVRSDHVHPLNVSGSVPASDAGGSPGVATTYARSDHSHPFQVNASLPATLVGGGAGTTGVSSFYSRHDHAHPMSGVMVGQAIYGQVNAAGGISKAGSGGWTSSRISLGHYRITFSPALGSTNYSTVVNCQENAPATMAVAKILDELTTRVDIFTGNSGGSAVDEIFNFQIMTP